MKGRALSILIIVFLQNFCAGFVIAAEMEVSRITSKKDNTNAYALLIGINQYKHVRDLMGAVNDVHNIKRLLVDSFNFIDDPQHIKVLIDEQATRAGIIEAIENHLLARVDQNSIVVLHYSGHGSQLKDVSGDEADGFDETIVPHDSGRHPHPNKDITDDELNLLLARLTARTPNVTFIFDSCHSGTATRASGLARTIPADDRQPMQQELIKTEALARGSERSNNVRANNAAYVLISGSAANEEALELRQNGQSFGAMSWFLMDQIRQVGADATYRDVMDIVKAKVSIKYPGQHPQLEGTGRDRLIFNTRSVMARPYIHVGPVKNSKKIMLNAGKVHGVSEGSIYDVFPAAEKQFTDPEKVIAKIKVIEALSVNSVTEIIAGNFIPVASRAVERQHNYSNKVLRVFVKNLKTSETLKQIYKELLNFRHIKMVPEEKNYDLLLRESEGYIITEAGDPTEISPRRLISETTVDEVVRQVIQWGKWFNILNINNANPRLKIKFYIDSVVSTEQLFEGTEFNITIENNSGKRLYPALIDLSGNGQIYLVFPKSGGNDYLAPGQSLTRRLRANLPKGLDSITDVLKIIATTEPTDYRFLEQAPLRNAPSLSDLRGRANSLTSPLEALMASAVLGTTRGQALAKNNLIDADNWVTLERTIRVLRRLP